MLPVYRLNSPGTGRGRSDLGANGRTGSGSRSAGQGPACLRADLCRALHSGPGPDILLATYFGSLGCNLSTATALPVPGLHLDLVRGGEDLDEVLNAVPHERWLSLGVVDGRNVWRTDLRAALTTLRRAADARGNRRLIVAPSCSLLHVPVDVEQETKLDGEVKSWLAFATQKLTEVALLTRALNEGEAAIAKSLEASDAVVRARRESALVHQLDVASRAASITPGMTRRGSDATRRREARRDHSGLAVVSHDNDWLVPAKRQTYRRARGDLARAVITEAWSL